MIAPGFDDGSDSPFSNMKFPLMNDPVMQSGVGSGSNVFLAPLNSISAVQKAYAMHQENSESNNKDSNTSSKHSSHIISTTDGIPTFRAGELTVSLKNTKNDYDYSPTDFTKIDSMKGRNDYSLADLTQAMKFPDLAKLANFSPSELAKLTNFSLNDFTKAAASSSAYVRNIANLFGPLSKGVLDPAENDRRPSDFADISSPFKPTSASSPSPKESGRSVIPAVEDSYSFEKKSIEAMETQSFSGTEDLSMTSSLKPDFSTIDMTTKKHQQLVESGDSLNLTKERQQQS